jgi:hypothetical protein
MIAMRLPTGLLLGMALSESDDHALEFLKDRPDLFPNTPVFFCGINSLELARSVSPARFTGVVEVSQPGATVRIARRL